MKCLRSEFNDRLLVGREGNLVAKCPPSSFYSYATIDLAVTTRSLSASGELLASVRSGGDKEGTG